jgi:hypothetical protein
MFATDESNDLCRIRNKKKNYGCPVNTVPYFDWLHFSDISTPESVGDLHLSLTVRYFRGTSFGEAAYA